MDSSLNFPPLSLAIVVVVYCILSACSSQPRTFLYPTQEEQEIQWMCEMVFTPRYAATLGPSRSKRIRQAEVVDGGVKVMFTDTNEYFLPIRTTLSEGKVYRCARPDVHFSCQDSGNTDPLCLRDSPLREKQFE